MEPDDVQIANDTSDVGAVDSSPAENMETENSQEQDVSQEEQGASEEEIVAKKSGHIPYARFEKQQKAYKQAQAQLAALQQEMQGLSGAKALHARLSQDTNLLRHVLDLVEGKSDLKSLQQPQAKTEQEIEEEKINWDEFDPVIKNHHTKLSALEKKVDQLLQEREATTRQSLETHQADIDDYFDSMLIRDGFMGADKKATKINSLIQKATLAEIAETARDPQRPTRAEVDKAYRSVVDGLGHFEKFKQTKQVTPPDVPLSGTKKGNVPSQGKNTSKMSEQDRINYWANLMG